MSYLALSLVLQRFSSSSGRSSDDTHHTLTAVVAPACRCWHTAVTHALLARDDAMQQQHPILGPPLYGEVKQRVEATKRLLDDSGDLASWHAKGLNRVGQSGELEERYRQWLAMALPAGHAVEIERFDARAVSASDIAERALDPLLPAVITHATGDWSVMREWQPARLFELSEAGLLPGAVLCSDPEDEARLLLGDLMRYNVVHC